jgi:hypothetical protein
MLLKFKNKHLMALDKMVKEAEGMGGMIDSVVLDLKEAYGLILELVNLGAKHIGPIKITDLDGVDITRQELIWNGMSIDKNERVKKIVNSWYKLHFKVKYENIPLVVVKTPKKEKEKKALPPPEKSDAGWNDVPDVPKPKGPPNRIISEGGVYGVCDKCGSSWKSKWFFFKGDGCLQPECENYWDKEK